MAARPALVLGSVALLGACRPDAPATGGAEIQLPDPEPRDSQEFDDAQDLLGSIRAGTFGERADVEPLAPPVPEPLEVSFERGTEVSRDQWPSLRALAESLLADSRLGVDLLGCSDPSGGEALNRRISQARAEAVAEMLVEFDVPASRIREVQGRGEDCALQERVVVATPFVAEAPRGGEAEPSEPRAGSAS